MDKEEDFKIIVTQQARKRYQETVLEYLFTYFSTNRAIEIDKAIFEKVSSLKARKYTGTKENYLSHFKEDFRFILHKEHSSFEIKIIYFVSEENKSIFVTDFFPTKMNPDKLTGRLG